MSKEKIFIFDTTLRDGAQTQGVDFSVEDKNKIAKVLSEVGVDYIEGGWPGANPVDTEFFSKPIELDKSIFTAFGMTKKTGRSAENDPSLSSLINASCSAVCVVGWLGPLGRHVVGSRGRIPNLFVALGFSPAAQYHHDSSCL